MEKQNRLNLRSNFRTGDRPTQEDFENVFESHLNFLDDEVAVDENKNMSIGGGLTLTNNSNAPASAGTIRWNGTEFEGHDGTTWGPLGGGDSPWAADSGNLIFSSGNVGIGDVSSPTDVLEVEVNAATSKVRVGNSALGNGTGIATRNNAVFSHTSLRSQTNYALMQNGSGTTYINCPTGQKIEFRFNNLAQAAFEGNNLVVGASSLISTNSQYRLQVAGSAFKNDGNDVFNNTSDIRTKDDITTFEDGLSVLKKIDPIKFKYNGKANTRPGLQCVGISAQQLQQVYPGMVIPTPVNKQESGLDSSEVLTTNLSDLKFLMLNAIKELDKRLEELEQSRKDQEIN